MAGKRPAASSNKGGKGQLSEKPSEKQSSKNARKSKTSKSNGWPLWLWVVGGVGLVVCFGRILASGGSSSPAKSVGKSGSKKAASTGATSTQRFLQIALRLQEMTELATELESSGRLDSEAAREMDKELNSLEAEIGDEGTVARDLRSMVSVVRGTLYQRGNKLTDEEVEATGSAFTYANPRYWDDYYKKTSSDEKYDWYGSWDTPITETTFHPRGAGEDKASALSDLLRPYLAPDDKILMFGCGNSDMSEKMYVDGFENIMNIDISEQLLEHLRSRGAAMPKMRWQLENASALTFGDAEFDVTVDKGTLDAIEQNKPLLRAAAMEAHRTLRPGGYFLSITFNGLPVRVEGQLRDAADWGECHTHEFERPGARRDSDRSVYFVHACQKRS